MDQTATAEIASTAPAAINAQSWESLRREARKLENELDMKLASFGKQYAYDNNAGSEIESLIDQLKRLNDAILEESRTQHQGNHRVLAQRHADILQDFVEEYKRLNSLAAFERSRVDLLGGGAQSGNSSILGGESSQPGNGTAKGLLLRERGALDRAHSGIDNVVAQAYGVASGLSQQRQLFQGIDSRLGILGAKFPAMNSVLNAIRRKKNRDAVILSSVAGFLFVLMFVYWVRK
jgi:Golgi SNAP receptor complex protein 1